MIKLPVKIKPEEIHNLKAGFKQPFEIKKDTPDRQSEIKGIEFWTSVTEEGFDHYYISSKGRVWNSKTKRLLKGDISNKGYLRVHLHNKNIQRKYSVHRLVALAFIVNPNCKKTVNHIDGDKLNNHIENLEWLTLKENIKHAQKNGLRLIVKNEQIERAVSLRKLGYTYKEISEELGYSDETASRYIRLHVEDNPQESYLKEVVEMKIFTTKEQVEEIITLRKQGLTQYEIAEIVGVSQGTVGSRCKEAGLLYERRVTTNEQDEQIRELRKDGWTYKKLSETYGVSQETIRNRCIEVRSQYES